LRLRLLVTLVLDTRSERDRTAGGFTRARQVADVFFTRRLFNDFQCGLIPCSNHRLQQGGAVESARGEVGQKVLQDASST
jgi:hypothetical protein